MLNIRLDFDISVFNIRAQINLQSINKLNWDLNGYMAVAKSCSLSHHFFRLAILK